MERDYGLLSGMVVHQDDGGGGELERALDHLARIDRGVIDGAGLMLLVGDQVVVLAEEQTEEWLLAREGHAGAAIVEHVRPRAQPLALFALAAHEPIGRRLHDLELGDGGLAETDLLQPLQRRRDHLGEGAERGEQVLRERLHVALRDGAKQDELEHFVIADRLASGGEESLLQASAMAVVMRRLVGGRCRRLVAAGHRTIIRAAPLVARRPPTKMTGLYLVLQCQRCRPRESGDPYSRIGGYGSPLSRGRQSYE